MNRQCIEAAAIVAGDHVEIVEAQPVFAAVFEFHPEQRCFTARKIGVASCLFQVQLQTQTLQLADRMLEIQ